FPSERSSRVPAHPPAAGFLCSSPSFLASRFLVSTGRPPCTPACAPEIELGYQVGFFNSGQRQFERSLRLGFNPRLAAPPRADALPSIQPDPPRRRRRVDRDPQQPVRRALHVDQLVAKATNGRFDQLAHGTCDNRATSHPLCIPVKKNGPARPFFLFLTGWGP